MRRGDLYWAALPEPVGRRPVVIVTRTSAIPVRTRLTVAPVTTTIRGIASEVPLHTDEGLKLPSVAACDDLATIPKRALVRRIGTLGAPKLREMDAALRYALDIAS